MGYFAALAFLTVLPSPARKSAGTNLGRTFPYFPLVGLTIGVMLAVLNWLFSLVFAPVVVDALLVVSMIVVTGALHLDGLMDTCDGVLNPSSPQRRLEIMKDSRVGGFGVAGAIALLLLKFAALFSLSGDWRLLALLLAPVLSRWAMVYASIGFPYGRAQGGLGRLFLDSTGRWALITATIIAFILALLIGRMAGLILMLSILVITYGLAKFVMTRIPGLTGDVYGATSEICETAVLLLFPVVAAQLPAVLIGF
jgi:adenosylcobinamide-GDP ribazoletransferase